MDATERKTQHATQLFALGRLDEAEQAAGEALGAAPEDAALHVLMSRIQIRLGDYAAAVAAADTALQLETSVPALHAASTARRLIRDFDGALDLLDRAISLNPEMPELHVSRSMALTGPWFGDSPTHDVDATGKDALRLAIDAADEAASLAPDNAWAHYARARCALPLQDLPQAATHLTTALALEPDWAEAHLLLAHVRALQGMAAVSSRHLAAAGALNPTDEAALSGLHQLNGTGPRKGLDRKTVGWAVGPSMLVAIFTIPAGVPAAILTFLLAFTVAVVGSALIQRRRKATVNPFLVGEAQQVLAADIRMNEARP